MIKLSKLEDEAILITDCKSVVTKEDVLNEINLYKKENYQLYTTTQYTANLNAEKMLDSELENEYQDMYEDWYQNIWEDVTPEDIKEIQNVLDRILARSPKQNIAYLEDEEVEIDM